VQWLVAAMTVGLGFGLQEIFANFIAGLIVLFERPIRVGDMVTLGTVSGTVTKIRMRATTIVDWDRKELIVPNKEFITGQLINWTLSDQTLRLVIPVGVAYGSDTELVEKLLLEVARGYEHVVADPPPTVMFSAFGESSLDFQLRVFIGQFDHLWRTRHALCMAIDKAFRTAGVEISFPQRDLHLRSIASPIEISLRSDAGAAATQSPASDRPD
jgi:potassium efflux system protein